MPVSAGDRPPLPPRERILQAAVRLVSTRGVTGTGLRETVAASDTPRGSLQHHFPRGKDQLVTKAITIAGAVIARTGLVGHLTVTMKWRPSQARPPQPTTA